MQPFNLQSTEDCNIFVLSSLISTKNKKILIVTISSKGQNIPENWDEL